MLRGEFNTEVSGKKIKTEFLTRDNFYYTWTSSTPGMGLKIRTASTDVTKVAPNSGTIGFNPDTIGAYSCEPWLADQTKFILPLGVTFKDVTP
ncbi:hypothetical protein EPO56_00250 [Patescibacteria group bacterium]|nr:MAG: hypothetical protein EPO56_00250 [Patescibacteria group bacterium]